MCQLQGETRIAKVIVGIVLAMRYLHSMGVIHCDLNPNNILLDLDWNIRIAGFGHHIFPHELVIPNDSGNCSFIGSHYLAPECYDNEFVCESDVFSFGLILYELVVSEPAFPKTLSQYGIAKRLIIENKRPIIPAFVLPAVQELIRKCWKRDYWRRPTFNDILDQLEAMNFKLTANVKSSKLSEFVRQIKAWEANQRPGGFEASFPLLHSNRR
jgi:serine/threonine-protein kinase